MTKNNRILMGISLGIAVLQLITAAIMTLRLPDTIPSHFDLNWVCDGMASRYILLIPAVLPLIADVIGALVSRKVKPDYAKVTAWSFLLLTAYLTALFWMIYPAMNSGVTIGEQISAQPFTSLLPLLYALMFVVIGNYMPLIQPNKTFGLRLGWTLNNPQCWRVTHRFAGRLWVITGLLLCIAALVGYLVHHAGEMWFYVLFGEVLFVNIIVPCIYAWKHKDDGREGAVHA